MARTPAEIEYRGWRGGRRKSSGFAKGNKNLIIAMPWWQGLRSRLSIEVGGEVDASLAVPPRVIKI